MATRKKQVDSATEVESTADLLSPAPKPTPADDAAAGSVPVGSDEAPAADVKQERKDMAEKKEKGRLEWPVERNLNGVKVVLAAEDALVFIGSVETQVKGVDGKRYTLLPATKQNPVSLTTKALFPNWEKYNFLIEYKGPVPEAAIYTLPTRKVEAAKG